MFRTHGYSNLPEYKLWVSIKNRCLNSNSHAYKDYGGRGITICKEWVHSFETFLNHIGRRPNPKLTIDRIDNDAGYVPGNVRWATRAQQVENRRSSRIFEFDGRRQTLKEWASILGIEYSTLRKRIKRGVSIEAAFTKRPKYIKRSVA